jgi:hypothetical protein
MAGIKEMVRSVQKCSAATRLPWSSTVGVTTGQLGGYQLDSILNDIFSVPIAPQSH